MFCKIFFEITRLYTVASFAKNVKNTPKIKSTEGKRIKNCRTKKRVGENLIYLSMLLIFL